MLRGWTSKWNLCLPSFTMLYPVFLCIYGVWCIFFCHDCCCIFNSLLPYVPLLSLSSKLWEELLPNDQANRVWYRRSRFMMVLSRISWWIDEVMKEQAKQFFDEGTWQQQLACHTLLPFYHLFRRSISVVPLLSYTTIMRLAGDWLPLCNRSVSLRKFAIVSLKLSNLEPGRTATASDVSWNFI